MVSSDLFLEKLSEAKAANHREIEVPTTGVITDHVVPLVDHPACKGDLIELHKSCHATRQEMRENDVIALICAQNADPDHSGLSNTCQVWSLALKQAFVLSLAYLTFCFLFQIPSVNFKAQVILIFEEKNIHNLRAELET